MELLPKEKAIQLIEKNQIAFEVTDAKYKSLKEAYQEIGQIVMMEELLGEEYLKNLNYWKDVVVEIIKY